MIDVFLFAWPVLGMASATDSKMYVVVAGMLIAFAGVVVYMVFLQRRLKFLAKKFMEPNKNPETTEKEDKEKAKGSTETT